MLLLHPPQMHARTGALSGYVPSGQSKPWKKLEGTAFLDGSPASGLDGNVLGNCWASWQCAAVQVPLGPSPRPCQHVHVYQHECTESMLAHPFTQNGF